MSVLDVVNLRKSYDGHPAVVDVSFTIDSGEIFGLLGPNGAGKSTTINVIATLLPPDAGRITVNGIPTTQPDNYKRRIGYVPQEISLCDSLSAKENLFLIGRLYDLGGAHLRSRVAELLDAVGLADRAGDRVAAFSGGMKRRLNIAAALLHDPQLMLLDEPTAGVDPQARAYIFEIIEKLAARGMAVLYTTHYMEEAQRLCRRTAIIDHGRILAQGTLAELLANHRKGRDLVVEAAQIDNQRVAHLAASLGGLAWQMQGTAAHLILGDRECPLSTAAQAAHEAGLQPTSLRLAEPNLETVFLELTGRALRD